MHDLTIAQETNAEINDSNEILVSSSKAAHFEEVSIDDLVCSCCSLLPMGANSIRQIAALPPKISYSSLRVQNQRIRRRDLFDAKFQAIVDDSESLPDLQSVSDLQAGQYEGGKASF